MKSKSSKKPAAKPTKAPKRFIATIDFKEPDVVGDMCAALGVSESTSDKFFEFGEYGAVELTVEGPSLKITAAKFLKRGGS